MSTIQNNSSKAVPWNHICSMSRAHAFSHILQKIMSDIQEISAGGLMMSFCGMETDNVSLPISFGALDDLSFDEDITDYSNTTEGYTDTTLSPQTTTQLYVSHNA